MSTAGAMEERISVNLIERVGAGLSTIIMLMDRSGGNLLHEERVAYDYGDHPETIAWEGGLYILRRWDSDFHLAIYHETIPVGFVDRTETAEDALATSTALAGG